MRWGFLDHWKLLTTPTMANKEHLNWPRGMSGSDSVEESGNNRLKKLIDNSQYRNGMDKPILVEASEHLVTMEEEEDKENGRTVMNLLKKDEHLKLDLVMGSETQLTVVYDYDIVSSMEGTTEKAVIVDEKEDESQKKNGTKEVNVELEESCQTDGDLHHEILLVMKERNSRVKGIEDSYLREGTSDGDDDLLLVVPYDRRNGGGHLHLKNGTTTVVKCQQGDNLNVNSNSGHKVESKFHDCDDDESKRKVYKMEETAEERMKGLALVETGRGGSRGDFETRQDSGATLSCSLDYPPCSLESKWRILFDKFDTEGFGEIKWDDFLFALKSPHFMEAVEPGKILLLETMAKSQCNSLVKTSTAITCQHFINIMSGKRSRSFKCAVHHRDREVCSESDFHLLPFGYKSPTGVKRMARLIADEFLTDERDRKYYADHYRCLPPPLFIISVTLIELGFFTYYTVWHGEISSSGPLPMDSPFVYRPDKRQEVWRFLFYMVLHAGWVHLMFNLLVQLLVGLPLEMVHGSLRIGCVYMAGVLAGSLGTSVFDPDVYLVGASGGVYALLAAHLANVLLNYNNMEFGLVRLVGVFLIASVDVGFAIYDRYAPSPPLTEGSVPPVSYVAHLTGALAGLTIGLLVLKNFEQKLREQLMWWFALGVYAACTLFAILFNIFHPEFPYNYKNF